MAGAIRFGQSYQNTFREQDAFGGVQLDTSSALAASGREAYLDTPEASLARIAELEAAKRNVDAGGDHVYYPPKDEWQKEFGHLPGLKYDDKINIAAWKVIAERKQRELTNQYIASHGSGSAWEKVGQFGVGAVASLASPTDIGLSFIPIVGEAKMAALVGRVGKVGARILAGAAEGGVGAAMTEPFAYIARTQEQADYDAWTSLQNVAFGAAFGATLRVGGGAVADFLKGRTKSTHLHATETAVNQLMMDQQVNVSHVHAADPDFTTPDFTHVGTDDLDPGTPGIQTYVDVQNGGVGKSAEGQIANTEGGGSGPKYASEYDILEAAAQLGKHDFENLGAAIKDHEVQAMLNDMGFDGYDLGWGSQSPFDNLDPKTGKVKAGESPGQVSAHEDGTIDDLVEAADHAGITPEEFEGMADPMAVPAIAKKLLDLGFKTIEGIPIPNPAASKKPKKVKAIKNEKPTGILAENLADMAPATDYVPNQRISAGEIAEFEGPLHIDDFEKTGGQLGSNPGGVHVDKATGKSYYIKSSAVAEPVPVLKNEYLANRMYRQAGMAVFDQRLVIDKEGRVTGVGSEMVDGLTHVAPEELAADTEFLRGFAMDAWLANWDVLASGNVMRAANGQIVRTDVGGSLLFRAKGEPKGEKFGSDMAEWRSMRKGAFSTLTDSDPDLLDGVRKVLSFDEESIKGLIAAAGLDGKRADETYSKLIARQHWLANKFPDIAKEAHALNTKYKQFYSTAEIADFINAQGQAYRKFLNATDKEAMKYWQTGPYNSFNHYLFNKVVKNLPDEPGYEKKAAELDAALKKFKLTEGLHIFRSANSWELFDGLEWGSKANPEDYIGKVREFEGFTASTLHYNMAKNWSGDVILRLRVPEGHPGMFMKAASDTNLSEYEFLFPRNTKIRLLSVTPLTGRGSKKYEAVVEVLPYYDKKPEVNVKSLNEFLKQQAEGKFSLFEDVNLKEVQEAASKPQALLDLAEAQAHLDEVMQQVDVLKASEALSEADLNTLKLADENVKMAEASGKAHMAAALCLKGKI